MRVAPVHQSGSETTFSCCPLRHSTIAALLKLHHSLLFFIIAFGNIILSYKKILVKIIFVYFEILKFSERKRTDKSEFSGAILV